MGINRGGSQPNLSNTLYEQAEIVDAYMIEWWYNTENLLPKITNSRTKSAIEQPGQNIVFLSEPEAQVVPYLRDEPINWTTMKPERTSITVDYAYISAHKLDIVDEYEIKLPLLSKIAAGMGKKHSEKELEVFMTVVPALSFLAKNIVGIGATYNTVTGVSTGTRTSGINYIVNQLVRLRTIFNRARVPKAGRYIVVSPEVEELLIASDQATYNISGKQGKEIEDGEWGIKVAGFEILVSEFVPGDGSAGNPYKCLVGIPEAIGFGRRIQKTELNVQLQDYVAKGHRSLNYFGFGALNLKGLGLLKVQTQ